jgi:hypothetical protein
MPIDMGAAKPQTPPPGGAKPKSFCLKVSEVKAQPVRWT